MELDDIWFKYSGDTVMIFSGDVEVGQMEHKGEWKVVFNTNCGWLNQSVLQRVVAKVTLLNLIDKPKAA